jgi:hypothetical protein
MMGQAIGGSLPLAVGIALSPIPIIAVVLMLTSQRAKVNGPPFVLGWLSGLGIIGALVLAVAVAGAAAITQTGISGGQQVIAYVVFALIGTLGVGIPVGMYFAMGKRSEKLLAGLKDWMTDHNAVIMTVLCLIIAAKLIGDGISGLAS